MEKLDVVNAALGALKAGKTCELVVVAGTAGSSPRGVGAWMAVFADGAKRRNRGGKIELFALDEARELLAAGQSRLVRYTMGGENSDTGMICGGAICLCYLHLDVSQVPLFQSVADVLAYRRIGDFVIDFEPFIASALEGDVAEYMARSRAAPLWVAPSFRWWRRGVRSPTPTRPPRFPRRTSKRSAPRA